MPRLFKAICQSFDGAYYETDHFYATEEEAMAWHPDHFVGLFSSGPQIEDKNYVPKYPHAYSRLKFKEFIKPDMIPPEINAVIEKKSREALLTEIRKPVVKENQKKEKEQEEPQVDFESFFGTHIGR